MTLVNVNILLYVSDAHLAALAVEHNCTLQLTDTDFARFRGLKWSNPVRE